MPPAPMSARPSSAMRRTVGSGSASRPVSALSTDLSALPTAASTVAAAARRSTRSESSRSMIAPPRFLRHRSARDEPRASGVVKAGGPAHQAGEHDAARTSSRDEARAQRDRRPRATPAMPNAAEDRGGHGRAGQSRASRSVYQASRASASGRRRRRRARAPRACAIAASASARSPACGVHRLPSRGPALRIARHAASCDRRILVAGERAQLRVRVVDVRRERQVPARRRLVGAIASSGLPRSVQSSPSATAAAALDDDADRERAEATASTIARITSARFIRSPGAGIAGTRARAGRRSSRGRAALASPT